ncbi:MAG: 30S ribosome-binding factor RbfA [Candidatus Dasytiphilus stammeri]
MTEITRLLRVSKTLKKEITIILHHKIKDPRLKSLITVNHIDLSRDGYYAKVFFTFLDIQSNKIEICQKIKVLQHASGYIRMLLGKAMSLRIIPQLDFIYDSSVSNAVYMYDFITKVLKTNPHEY